MKNFNSTIFSTFLAVFLTANFLQAQCTSANFQNHRGGAITCNFPFLHQDDVDYYVERLEDTDADVWYEEKNKEAERSLQKWKTHNLRILMLTNSDDIISPAQLETLRLAMNLHLVDIAKANSNDQLDWMLCP